MITNAHKISADGPGFQATFQQEILEHWRDIRANKPLPKRRDFRPQKFPKSLGQLAIVNVHEDLNFSDRLTGGLVCEVLKLPSGPEKLFGITDENIRHLILKMLTETVEAGTPMYYEGSFNPAERPQIDFSVIILPFAENEDVEKPESLLLAFNFKKHTTTNIIHT